MSYPKHHLPVKEILKGWE